MNWEVIKEILMAFVAYLKKVFAEFYGEDAEVEDSNVF